MNQHSILHVDDDAQAISLQQQAFKQAGIRYPVHVVTDSQGAIDYLAGNSAGSIRKNLVLPSLILLKLELPRQPGTEVLQWVRAQATLKAIVVIMLITGRHSSDLERAFELGANSCVLQPSALEGWLELARALRHWWFGQNQFAPVRRGAWRSAGARIRASH